MSKRNFWYEMERVWNKVEKARQISTLVYNDCQYQLKGKLNTFDCQTQIVLKLKLGSFSEPKLFKALAIDLLQVLKVK